MKKKVIIILIILALIGGCVEFYILSKDNFTEKTHETDKKDEIEKTEEIKKNVTYKLKKVEFEKGTYASYGKNDKIRNLITEEDEKFYITDLNGKLINKTGYDDIEELYSDGKAYFIVEENGKQGIIDEKGNIVLDYIYDSIVSVDIEEENQNKIKISKRFLSSLEDEYALGYLSKDGLKLTKFYKSYRFNETLQVNNKCSKYCPVIEDNTLNYVNYKGETIVEGIKDGFTINDESRNVHYYMKNSSKSYFDLMFEIENEDYFIIINDDKCGVKNSKNEIVLPIEYDYIGYNELTKSFIVVKNDLIAAVDINGKIIYKFNDSLKITKNWEYDKNIENCILFYNTTEKRYVGFNNNFEVIYDNKENPTYYAFYDKFMTFHDINSTGLIMAYDYNKNLLLKDVDMVIHSGSNDYIVVNEKGLKYLYDNTGKKIFDRGYKNFHDSIYGNIYADDGYNFYLLNANEKEEKALYKSGSKNIIAFRMDEKIDSNKDRYNQLLVFNHNDERLTVYSQGIEKVIIFDEKMNLITELNATKDVIYYDKYNLIATGDRKFFKPDGTELDYSKDINGNTITYKKDTNSYIIKKDNKLFVHFYNTSISNNSGTLYELVETE